MLQVLAALDLGTAHAAVQLAHVDPLIPTRYESFTPKTGSSIRGHEIHGGVVDGRTVGEGQRVLVGGDIKDRAGRGHGIAHGHDLALGNRAGGQCQDTGALPRLPLTTNIAN